MNIVKSFFGEWLSWVVSRVNNRWMSRVVPYSVRLLTFDVNLFKRLSNRYADLVGEEIEW